MGREEEACRCPRGRIAGAKL